jgi:hypothetical protein
MRLSFAFIILALSSAVIGHGSHSHRDLVAQRHVGPVAARHRMIKRARYSELLLPALGPLLTQDGSGIKARGDGESNDNSSAAQQGARPSLFIQNICPGTSQIPMTAPALTPEKSPATDRVFALA